jgi:hypothetical protein
MRKAHALLSRDTAKARYSIDTMISQWNAVFTDMMKEPKKKRGVL